PSPLRVLSFLPSMLRRPPTRPLFPYTTLFRSLQADRHRSGGKPLLQSGGPAIDGLRGMVQPCFFVPLLRGDPHVPVMPLFCPVDGNESGECGFVIHGEISLVEMRKK